MGTHSYDGGHFFDKTYKALRALLLVGRAASCENPQSVCDTDLLVSLQLYSRSSLFVRPYSIALATRTSVASGAERYDKGSLTGERDQLVS